MNEIKVFLKNINRSFSLPIDTDISELLRYIDNHEKYIAVIVNNETASLAFKLKVNSTVLFITISHDLGMEIYKRSLSFLLEKVVTELYPDLRLIIGHSLGPGYYFDLEGKGVTEDDVKAIHAEMRRQIDDDKKIIRDKITYIDALEHFKNNKRDDKYKLISGLNMSKLPIYRCDDFFQVFDLPLVDSTGRLRLFDLIYYPPGFIIQFPKKSKPYEVAAFEEQRNIFNVYQEYKSCGKILNVDNVGALNEIIAKDEIHEFIQVAEALQARKISSIADEIYKVKGSVRMICIAGPTSSGKTTFSKRLEIELKALGVKPVTISVDNYFVDRNKTPVSEDGAPDFESIEAINIKLFNNHLKKLLKNEEIKVPYFNFFNGKSELADKKMKLKDDEILLLEGIHCLNDKLTYSVKKELKYKIYISVLTQINIDDNNRIPTTDVRIIRRMVRDNKYRGHTALKTLKLWPSVRVGEEKNIFPYQNDANGYFSSALDYELALLKPYVEPLLMQVKPSDEEYAEASRLLKFLSYFLAINPKHVPSTSIIREFIGGSFFNY